MPGPPGDLVVKSKPFPRIGFVALVLLGKSSFLPYYVLRMNRLTSDATFFDLKTR